MSRKVRVFPPNTTDDEILDGRHCHHLPAREAAEKEQRGELVRIDVAGTVFVERGPLGLCAPRNFRTIPHPTLTAETVRRAYAAGGRPAAQARRRVEEFGVRGVAVPHLTFDEVDVWVGVPRGDPVLADLRRRVEDVAAAVQQYLASRWPARSVKVNLSEPALAARLNQVILQRRAEIAATRNALLKVWPRVVIQFRAGKFSAPFNNMRPDRLPPEVVYLTLQAYLEG